MLLSCLLILLNLAWGQVSESTDPLTNRTTVTYNLTGETLGKKTQGPQLNLTVGNVLAVALSENPTTGYRWNVIP